jgi:hypothetical protein
VFSPYGDNWSNYFVSDLLSTSFSAIGSSDFTLEFWAMVEEDTTGRWFAGTGTGTGSFQIGAGSGGKWSFYTESNTLRFNGTTSIAENTWYHVAVSRSGSTIKLFINGSEEASATDSVNYSATSLGIGGYSSTNASCYGYISNFRIVVGTAVYTSAFTPSTTPLTAITNTKLLTCQSNRFVDNSSDGNAISVQTGTPKVTRFSPFESDKPYDITTYGGSGYFDGSGDYLSADSLNIGNFGTADFTVEGWFYLTTAPVNYIAVCETRLSGATTTGWTVAIDGSGSFYVYSGAFIVQSSSGAIESNTWYHYAYTRESGTHRLFLNGSLIGSSTTSRTYSDDNFRVGANLAGLEPFTGYESDVRVVKGTAVYTSAFTPPTAPLTAVTNTEFLLNFQDSAIPDLSGINNIDTVGNAKVSASDPTKYGSNAMQFDGTGDYLQIPDTEAFNLGDGDFTLECWFNARNLDSSSNYGLISSSTNTSNFWTLRIRNSTDDGIQFRAYQSANLVDINQGADFTTSDTWVHVAVTREGSTFRLFKDGTLVDSATYSGSFSKQSTNLIGNVFLSQTQTMDGFMDDVRITKGIARYTSNFTPPTDALPKF